MEGSRAEAQSECSRTDRQAHTSNSHTARHEGLPREERATEEEGGLQLEVRVVVFIASNFLLIVLEWAAHLGGLG